ncbi:MAG: hypothetical protein M3Z54_02590 [Gemmatimonadota bacterium]|nr:hypothetical protein [Gemmatimonadota bacterium]
MLIDEVARICRRLAKGGWASLLEQHGFSLSARDLEAEFAKPLTIRRSNQGFEDFAIEGVRAIEPGNPARSLFYHALASQRVTRGRGLAPLQVFPTLHELDVIENYVYSVGARTIADLHHRVRLAPLAVVVFAYEYRPAAQTSHKRHADLVFSRTGISRVGTAPPRYVPALRGFVPYDDADAHTIRVSPARYGAFIAALSSGDEASFCPMRFRNLADNPDGVSDADRRFWLPVHKLFPGSECLRGVTEELTVDFGAHHVNEKLRRVHLGLRKRYANHGVEFESGWKEPDISRSPFRFSAGIATLARGKAAPPGLLVPRPHARLVEAAEYEGKPLGFNVPLGAELLSSSVRIAGDDDPSTGEVLHAPEYVHARTLVTKQGREEDLNALQSVAERVRTGGYIARHYLDYTADGWITVTCPQITEPAAHNIGEPIAAYSLVAAPDFLYRCDQRELTEWTDTLEPTLRDELWQTKPDALSDQRFPANLQLPGSPFSATDRTISAIVSAFGEVATQQTSAPPLEDVRHSHLPDDAAGVFAPGWDVSHDWRLPERTQHLAAYGLGSPFPEDMKLCTALATYWPAVAPDSTRIFTFGPENNYRTICPLTDEETGQMGGLPWDGIRGPREIVRNGRRLVEFPSFDHTDYVAQALKNKFSFRVTAHIGADEYHRRVVAMTIAYRAVEATTKRARALWVVLSFRRAEPGDGELQDAQRDANTTLIDGAYRFEMFRCAPRPDGSVATAPRGQPFVRHMVPHDETTLFIDPGHRLALIRRHSSRHWRRCRLRVL